MYPAGTTLRIDLGAFSHYGIADGNGAVIHNSKKRLKITRESYDEFSGGREILSSNITGSKPETAVLMAERYIGMPYDLFASNCEHFVRLVHGLEKESVQIQKYLLVLLGAGIAATSDNNALKAAGGALSIATLLTPSEKSPYKNAAVFSLITAGLVVLAG
ncbi:hypothetical protein BGP77_11505 [Saccharospirillum sp. MSK14-1]|uniref:lecithin retinol acyltransferase family protein n=1 Tax=Saccharospirillum sp. MSK14-1 TaxID=1897632 RepID=UPI000D371BAB|nr:lecithin retinol acyltransferase family protein [Saccharospirillum sp. MSK14-1]PTY38566.1 hypothetical protein BGP77_11505 [Saccharospirillum sp. MSK14-1]